MDRERESMESVLMAWLDDDNDWYFNCCIKFYLSHCQLKFLLPEDVLFICNNLFLFHLFQARALRTSFFYSHFSKPIHFIEQTHCSSFFLLLLLFSFINKNLNPSYLLLWADTMIFLFLRKKFFCLFQDIFLANIFFLYFTFYFHPLLIYIFSPDWLFLCFFKFK